MASPSPEPPAKSRHLRPRDGNFVRVDRTTTPTPSMLETEDDELSANTTASYYLGSRPMKRKNDGLITIHNTPKRRRAFHGGGSSAKTGKNGDAEDQCNGELQDVYCWECHKECVEGALDCVSCPRTFHPLCIPSSMAHECGLNPSENWSCPVCLTVTKAECADTRSWSMQRLSVDELNTLLSFVLQRMKYPDAKTSEAFHNPVPASLLPDYYDVIFHPMDLSSLDRNIKKKAYASTEAFLEDAKWILHNSIIYNGTRNKQTEDAKVIIKKCRHELAEVELCPDCYLSSSIRGENWFTEQCTAPHCLVWAKLKGFPYWPAKALRYSSSLNVDVRFFGAHDRAWIPMNQVYLLSADCPVPIKNTKKYGLANAVNELNDHIKRLREQFGHFSYAPPKTEFKPEHLYFCPILFGNNAAKSADPTGLLNSARLQRHYSNEALDEQPCTSDRSRADDQQSSVMGDGQSSDGECSHQTDNAKGQNSSGHAHNGHDETTGVTAGQGGEVDKTVQSSDPPLMRPMLGQRKSSDSGVRKVASLNSPAAASIAQSPDSTSAQCPSLDTSVAGSKSGNVNEEAGGVLCGETSAPSKRPAVTAQAESTREEAQAKKRSLQSALEKMRTNKRKTSSRHTSVVSKVANVDSTKAISCDSAHSSMGLGATGICGKYLEKMNEFNRSMMSELAREIQARDTLPQGIRTGHEDKASADQLRAELVRMQTFYSEAIRAMKATTKITVTEVKNRVEADKLRAIEEMKHVFEREKNAMILQFEAEKRRVIEETKTKQWCANCGKEAEFYCCWNTSYCGYVCQQQHWPKHQATCAQIRQQPQDTGMASSGGSPSFVSAGPYVGRVNTSAQFGGSTSKPGGSNFVPLYASALQSSGLIRASLLPPTVCQSTTMKQFAALGRK